MTTIRADVADNFTREAKKLSKCYPHGLSDVSTLKIRLERGETPGDRLQDIDPYIVYKVRIKNTDARKGKSGGYRVIYYVQTSENIVLLTLYSKSDQTDISTSLIRRILDELKPSSPEEP